MRLYVVRHGSAKSKEEDPERNLSDRGEAEVKSVADLIKPLNIKVDTLYHSGKARAKGTAEIMAKAVQSANGVAQRDGLNPHDSVQKFSRELATLENDIMIASHLPFVGRLVAQLVASDPDRDVVDFPAGGAACLERTDKKHWVIRWLISPEILKR